MAGRTNIVLDRLVYYDNDSLVGEFILVPFTAVTIQHVTVEIKCSVKFSYLKPTGGVNKATSIFFSNHHGLVKDNYYARANEKLIYNFEFHIPHGLPPSMAYNRDVAKGLMGAHRGAVNWEICVSADVENVESLILRKRFVKSSLYRLSPDINNIGVTVDNALSIDDKDVQLSAAIEKRIYTKGEKIKLHIVVKNDSALPVVEINYACVLHLWHSLAKKSLGAASRDIYADSSMVQAGLPIQPGGSLDTHVVLWVRNFKMARHTCMAEVDDSEWAEGCMDQNSVLLLPSYHNETTGEAGKLGIEYMVRVLALLRKGIKLYRFAVEVPFVLSDCITADSYVPDMCYMAPDERLYTPNVETTHLVPMDGVPATPVLYQRDRSKGENYFRKLSRSASDLYAFSGH